MSNAYTAQELAARLRNACQTLRRTSIPLADMIPLMQQAADALASQAEPVATLHDDGCFTWKSDELRRKYDRQRAGWRMDVYAAPAQAEQSEDGRDAARLDFMIESDAFVVWSFRGDGSITQCQLWSQDEDEEYHIISGERYFNTPREAIDAAIAAKEQS